MEQFATTDFAAMAGMVAVMSAIAAAFYIYFAVILMVLARKTATPGGWMAWIPILNALLLCRIARKPGWWLLLFFIPLVNIVIAIIVWMGVAEARGKSKAAGVLMIVPLINLFVPLYLASGEGAPAQPPPTAEPPRRSFSRPSICLQCGTALDPGETFCGECGAPVRVTAAAPLHSAPRPEAAKPAGSSTSKVLATAVAGFIVIGLAAFVGLNKFGSLLSKPAAAPQGRMAGVLKEFPVDTNKAQPAKPTSVMTRNFEAGAKSSTPAPAKSLPPGVTEATLRAQAKNMTSASYKTSPQSPPVNVHVLETKIPPRLAVEQISEQAQLAAGPDARVTGVQVDSPAGSDYSGRKVSTPQSDTYVLGKDNGNTVVIVYAPEPGAKETAGRLAGNIGNGQGIFDYPELQDTAMSFEPPPGFELEEQSNFTADDLFNAGQLGGPEVMSTREVKQTVEQVRSLLPERYTAARYRDSSRRPWSVLVGDYGGAIRSWLTWTMLRASSSASGLTPGVAGGAPALTGREGNEQYLLMRRGSRLVLVQGPAGESVDRLASLAGPQ